jgi:hypothetical protein
MDNFDGHASRGMPHFHFRQLTEAANDEILSIEAYLDSRIVQRTLVSKVKRIASLLANTAEPPDDETEVIPIECVVRDISLSVALFNFLIDTGRLPETDGVRGRIVYELESIGHQCYPVVLS